MSTSVSLTQNSFSQVVAREWQRLRGSSWDLAMVSWVPLLAVALIVWIFSAGLAQQLPLAVLDQDHSLLSRQMVRWLQATPGLRVCGQFTNQAEVEHALRSGAAYAVVQIPPDFSRRLHLGETAAVTLLHNAQFGTHSGQIQRDVRTVVSTLSAGLELGARERRGASPALARVAQEPLSVRSMTLFNPSLNYEPFLAAALIPALLHIFAMTAGAWSLGRELRDRSIAEWITPRHKPAQALAALAAKLMLPLLALTLIGTLALASVSNSAAGAEARIGVMVALSLFLALSALIGAALALASGSLRMALSGTGFLSAPAFAVGGVGFPLLAMPALARDWANALPYTHYIRLQTQQLQMGAPLSSSLHILLGLALAVLGTAGLCTLLLRYRARRPDTWGQR
jgi:ABC-2 type transport system permease protein